MFTAERRTRMSANENKDRLRRVYEEVINAGELGRSGEFIATDMVDHEHAPGAEDLQGPELFNQYFSMVRSAFPDFECVVEDMVAEGDKVAARVTLRGTHQGEFMGIPPSGNRIEVTGIDIARFADGKMVEHWGNFDDLGMMQQLGAIPPPEQASG
jgi:steroid delta-isomerase-like uncharacterized protein